MVPYSLLCIVVASGQKFLLSLLMAERIVMIIIRHSLCLAFCLQDAKFCRFRWIRHPWQKVYNYIYNMIWIYEKIKIYISFKPSRARDSVVSYVDQYYLNLTFAYKRGCNHFDRVSPTAVRVFAFAVLGPARTNTRYDTISKQMEPKQFSIESIMLSKLTGKPTRAQPQLL